MRVVGLTATPFGKKVPTVYGTLVNVRTPNQLIKEGWLVPVRAFGGPHVDVRGLKAGSTGEWKEADLEERGRQIIGRMVPQYLVRTQELFGGPVKFICFSMSVRDGARVVEAFNAAGIPTEQVSYLDTDRNERRAKISAHRGGDLMGLVSCEALQRGYDVTDILCIIDRHPYRRAIASVLQGIGRGLRAHLVKKEDQSTPENALICYPDGREFYKKFVLLLDQARNYLGFQDEIESYFENGPPPLEDPVFEKLIRKEYESERPPNLCPVCKIIVKSWARPCPSCGYKPEPKPRSTDPEKIVVLDVDLIEIGPKGKKKRIPISEDAAWWQVVGYATRKYPNDGTKARRFALAQFKQLVGHSNKPWVPSNGSGEINADLLMQMKRNLAHYHIRQNYGRGKR